MKPLVLFSISNGWGIRNFFHTGLVASVSHFADVGVAASSELLPYFQELKRQGLISTVIELTTKEAWFWRIVRRAKKFVLQTRHNISTGRMKLVLNARTPFQRVCWNIAWLIAGKIASPKQIVLLDAFERGFNAPPTDALQGKPRVFVNCSPFDYRDSQLQRSLHGLGVPAIAIIPSWDNPSTKGCIPVTTDLILAWGEHQKSELLDYYPSLDPLRIRVSGVPQFDTYYQPLPSLLDRESFFRKLGVPLPRRVILYATCSEKLFPSEPEVVRDIVEAIGQDRFGKDVHLLIRCHPADRADRYDHLCASGRATIFPSSRSAKQNLANWLPPEGELGLLAASLLHSELCVNTASTMTLDAFACDKPVVNVAFDGDAFLPYHQSVRRYYDYHHYRPIAKSGAAVIARTSADLMEAIGGALEKPAELRRFRESVVARFCPHPAQGSVALVVDEIRKLLNDRTAI